MRIVFYIPCPIDSYKARCQIQKLPHRAALPRGNDVIVGEFLLQHQPHGSHIVLRVTPIATGIKVAQIEFLLQSEFDPAQTAGNLARHKSFAAPRGLMVKQDSVADEEIVSLALIDSVPMSGQLADSIRASWIKRCAFVLRRRRRAKHFRGSRLIKASLASAVLRILP